MDEDAFEEMAELQHDFDEALKRIAELEDNKAKSNEFINWFLDAVFKGSDICGDDAQDKMFELGILTREIYNPEIHTLTAGSECDEGDYIYFKSEEV